MKKRLTCLLLAVVMLIGLIPMSVFPASAAANLSVSEEGIQVIKNFMGFHEEAYASGSTYKIGYGTPSVEDAVITVENADYALREALAVIDKNVNNRLNAKGKTVVQKQHDALVWFVHAYGSGILNENPLTTLINTSASASTIANAICTVGYTGDYPNTAAADAVITRRMAIANMFINGVYSATDTGSFGMTTFDSTTGTFSGGATCKVQVYDCDVNNKITVAAPTRSDRVFQGWYIDDGEDDSEYGLVTELNEDTDGVELFARWRRSGGQIVSEYELPATVIFEAMGVASDKEVPVYNEAGGSTKIDTVFRTDTVYIVSERTVSGNKWIELDTGGWVNLGPVTKIPTFVPGTTVIVTDDYVNIRKGAGVNFEKVGQAERGDVLELYMFMGDWGYTDEGWVYLIYTNYFDVHREEIDDTEEEDEVVATGTVSTGSALNVRNSPNAGSTKVGSLSSGTKVVIYDIETVAGHKWGDLGYGWICLDYVVLDTTPSNNTSGSSNNSSSNYGSGLSGTIVNTDQVNVREKPGTAYNIVTTLTAGTSVKVYEQTKVDTANWGRTDKGWICMDYIKLNETVPTAGKTGKVNAGVNLVVRSGPGSEYSKVTTLAGGTAIEIEKSQYANGVQWGKVTQGWINMTFVTLDGGNNTTYGIGGYIVNCSTAANVRSAPGTSSTQVGTVAVGSRVFVTERSSYKGIYWGHINTGWVCMDYIQLDTEWKDPTPAPTPTPTPAAFAGYPAVMDTNSNLYESASSDSKVLMNIKAAAKVNILERKKVGTKIFGKVTIGDITGWVNMEDVSMSEINAKIAVTAANAYEEANTRSTFYAAIPKGTTVVILPDSAAGPGQIFDGSVVWGKLEHLGHICWIDLKNITMYADNKAPEGLSSKSGVGYLVGSVNTFTCPVVKDVNGMPNPAESTALNLVEGQRVDILERYYIYADASNWGKIKVGSTTGWIDMSMVTLSPVEMEVTADYVKAFNKYTDPRVELEDLVYEDIVTILERHLYLEPATGLFNDWGKVYVNDDPADIRYIILDENKLDFTEDAPEVPTTGTVQKGVVLTAMVKKDPTPVYEEANTGSKVVLKLDKSSYVTVLNWMNANGKTFGKVQQGTIIGWIDMDDLDLSDLTGTVAVGSLSVYSKCDFDSKLEILRMKDRVISIPQIRYEYDVLWGRIDVAGTVGWVDLSNMKLRVPAAPSTPVTTAAIMTGRINSVNKDAQVYKDDLVTPGDLSLPKNTNVSIIGIKSDGAKVWCKLELGEKDGWVEFEYITCNPATATIKDSKVSIWNDLVALEVMEFLYRDEKVNLISYQEHAGSLYGEIEYEEDTGWILLSDTTGLRVVLTPGKTNNSTGAPTTAPTTAPAPTTPVVVQGIPATIVTSTPTVNVRELAGMEYNVVQTLTNGTAVSIYEQVTVNGKQWANIGTGWVCMDYVQLGTGATGTVAKPVIMTTVPAGAVAVGYAERDLDVYGGAGFGYGKSGTIPKNSAVAIYENRLDGGVSWGRTDKGWVIISYITMTAIGQNGSGDMGTIARCGFTARVRSAAGINGLELTKVMISSRVAITDTQVVSGETWGKTALGWVSLNYVAMDTEAAPLPTVSAGNAEGEVG